MSSIQTDMLEQRSAYFIGQSTSKFARCFELADPYLAKAGVAKWQTRTLQGRVIAISWRFKSSLRHRKDNWRCRLVAYGTGLLNLRPLIGTHGFKSHHLRSNFSHNHPELATTARQIRQTSTFFFSTTRLEYISLFFR